MLPFSILLPFLMHSHIEEFNLYMMVVLFFIVGVFIISTLIFNNYTPMLFQIHAPKFDCS